jgi:hypothetical protein
VPRWAAALAQPSTMIERWSLMAALRQPSTMVEQ